MYILSSGFKRFKSSNIIKYNFVVRKFEEFQWGVVALTVDGYKYAFLTIDDKYQRQNYAIIRANTKLYKYSENTNSFYIF